MAGWKAWQPLEEVEAPDFQSYIQDQVVQVYANSSARSSALGTAVSAGMVSYLTGSTAIEYYNGSAWTSISNPGDITSVVAGTGLTGGGVSGDVTLNVNYSAVGSAITIGKTQVTGTAVVVADLASASVSYALTAGTAVYANTSGTAAYGTLAGTAVYADNAGTAVYATNAGTAVYATLAGTAVYATNAGTAVFATTAGTATPSAHASTHGAAGSDPVTIAKTQVTGTAVVLTDTGVVTNTMLQNSSITLNGTAVALGGTATISGGGASGDDDQIILPVQIFS